MQVRSRDRPIQSVAPIDLVQYWIILNDLADVFSRSGYDSVVQNLEDAKNEIDRIWMDDGNVKRKRV